MVALNAAYRQSSLNNQAELDALMQRVHDHADAQAREELICHHLPFARSVAASHFAKRYHEEIEFADYLQWATLAMIEALDRFDPGMDTLFTSFAAPRMRGAILDGVEASTDKQQQIALRLRMRQERFSSIHQAQTDCGGVPSSERPEAVDRLLSYLADVGIGLALSWLLENSGMVLADEDAADADHIPYLQVLELKQLQAQVRSLIDTLATQQKTVIRCHYVQDISFEAIARMLDLSKGRISQIHRDALDSLRQKLKGRQSCDVAW